MTLNGEDNRFASWKDISGGEGRLSKHWRLQICGAKQTVVHDKGALTLHPSHSSSLWSAFCDLGVKLCLLWYTYNILLRGHTFVSSSHHVVSCCSIFVFSISKTVLLVNNMQTWCVYVVEWNDVLGSSKNKQKYALVKLCTKQNLSWVLFEWWLMYMYIYLLSCFADVNLEKEVQWYASLKDHPKNQG